MRLTSLVVLAALGAGVAAAQPAPAPDQVARARTLFGEGREALATERFDDAYRLFRASFDAVPNAGTAFNLAVSSGGLGRWAEALSYLERLRAGELGALSEGQRAEVEHMIARARAEVATLMLSLEGPPEARLRLDGEDAGTVGGELPRRLSLDAGPHRLEASADGFVSVSRSLRLGRGEERTLTLSLDAAGDDTWLAWVLGTIGGAVLIGVGVAVAVALAAPGSTPALSDATFGRTETLVGFRF